MNVSMPSRRHRVTARAVSLGAATLVAALGALACGRQTNEALFSTDPPMFGEPVTTVEVYETGGIAGFVSDWVVRKEGGGFFYTRRRACTQSSASCPPALDSAQGVLDQATADSLFAAIARDTTGLHAADFGSSKSAADMINYVVRLRSYADVVTDARGDDGTMPPPMHRIVQAVHAAISDARK